MIRLLINCHIHVTKRNPHRRIVDGGFSVVRSGALGQDRTEADSTLVDDDWQAAWPIVAVFAVDDDVDVVLDCRPAEMAENASVGPQG
jgi:hypothetical protein